MRLKLVDYSFIILLETNTISVNYILLYLDKGVNAFKITWL